MSVQRSPTGSGSNVTRSGSYPNLTNKCNTTESTDLSQITFRNKRKFANENEEMKAEFSDLKMEFSEMRKQMEAMQNQMSELMTYLTTNNTKQIENFNKLCEDTASIKEQVNNIKSSMHHIKDEQVKLKTDISNIKTTNSTTEKKIELLESSLQKINSRNLATSSPVIIHEEVIAELNERTQRSKNILISGIPELTSTDPKERQEYDTSTLHNILKTVYPDCPKPEKIFRIGKYHPTKNRLIKACFECKSTPKQILRNKPNIKNNDIKIFSDQTPQQQAYFKNLKSELENRIKNGENNLCIKYVKDVPRIISTVPKNFKI